MMTAPSKIEVTDTPAAADLEVIYHGLTDFNDRHTGINDRVPMAVLVKDSEGRTVGGVTGRTSLGVLFLDYVFLPEALRGTGLGRRMLAEAEEVGRRRGCALGVLVTMNFQAPAFYKRNGWTVYGEIPSKPEGIVRYYMSKPLLSEG